MVNVLQAAQKYMIGKLNQAMINGIGLQSYIDGDKLKPVRNYNSELDLLWFTQFTKSKSI